jgi:hypothetical protein
MSATLPQYVVDILNKIPIDEDYPKIKSQCSPHADPLYQDWRYNIVCDTLKEFASRGITKEQLARWSHTMAAIYPWTPGYDIFRQIVNRRFVAFPWLIAMTNKESQVVRALRAAIRYKIPFCIRGGAHSYEPYSITDGFVIDQSRRTRISINHVNNQVTIEPGVLNGPLADKLGKYGLAIAQGTCANVGVVGLCLSGGMGFLGRKYGLTCDNLISFKLLTASGDHILVNKDTHPNLFWACRGGGNGNFGIITEMTLQAHYVPKVINFELRWNFNKIYKVLTTYFNWLRIDNDVGIEMDIFSLTRDTPVLITGVYAGSKRKLEKYLEVFLDLTPDYTRFWETSYIESARHFTYARFPPPYFKNKSYYVYDNLPKTVVPIIEKYMKTAGPNDRIEINGLGAAYDKVSPDGSAYSHRGALAWIQYITRWGELNSNPPIPLDINNSKLVPGWEDNKIGPERIAWVTALYNEIKEAAGNIIRGAYVGCFDSMLKNYLEQYYGSNLPRLKKIKEKWDPENKFRYPQSI